MTLLEIQDELSTARQFVECAFLACHGLDDSDGVAAVLDAASAKMKAVNKAIDALKERL